MTMIEQIARTIHAALAADGGADGIIAWEVLPEDAQARYRLTARRVVAAMRNPTERMLAEGDRRDLARDAANIWERMLFTALSETP